MTKGQTRGRGALHTARESWCCVLGAPSHIYIGGREGEAAKRGAQIGGILLGVPPKPRPPFLIWSAGKGGGGWHPPFPFSHERERQEGIALPFFLPWGWPNKGGDAPAPFCPLLWLIKPITCHGVPGTPSGDPIPSRYIPKHFRCPNTIVLYINLYLSTISRLLVMSVISSGTPNNIRSPKHITHITLYRQRTLSVRTLRVRELCRHDRDTSLVNNQ